MYICIIKEEILILFWITMENVSLILALLIDEGCVEGETRGVYHGI